MTTTITENLDLETDAGRLQFREEAEDVGAAILDYARAFNRYLHGNTELPPDRGVVAYHYARLSQVLHHFERLETKFQANKGATSVLMQERSKFTAVVAEANSAAKIISRWYDLNAQIGPSNAPKAAV